MVKSIIINEYLVFKLKILNEVKDINKLILFETKKFIFCLFYSLKSSMIKTNKTNK
jgi:hypothetical protein